nr:MAG TPA: hypothetical protein [Caudoviricetes sp.]
METRPSCRHRNKMLWQSVCLEHLCILAPVIGKGLWPSSSPISFPALLSGQ